jgi:lipoate-protein ligase A
MPEYSLWPDPLPRPGWLNMAVDEALLARAEMGERWVRLYAWEPTLSFGRHEPARRRYDAARIASLGLAVVRRPTGGRAVWHAGELTYAVALPTDGLGSVGEVYRNLHGLLCDALGRLGLTATLAPAERAASVDAGACFASPAGGEVMVAGRKVVGSAQLRRGSALLQHGSMLLADDQTVVAQVTQGPAPVDRSMPLSRIAGHPISWHQAAAAVTDALAAAWGAPTVVTSARRHELIASATATSERFRSPTWTWSGA